MIKPITLPPLPDDLIAHRMTETEVRSLLKRYGERCATAAIEADRKEIMKPALERADLAFIYDELLQSGKDRAAGLVRAALLAKCGQQGYTAADMASAAADGFRKGKMSAGEDAARYRTLRAMPPGIRVQVHVGEGEWEEILSGDELDGAVDSVRAYVL